MAKNVIVAQSGGPSPVINSSLRGIIEACRMFPDKFGKVYGGWHGIEGVLNEELLDLTIQDEEEISLLRNTPAAGSIGGVAWASSQDPRCMGRHLHLHGHMPIDDFIYAIIIYNIVLNTHVANVDRDL